MRQHRRGIVSVVVGALFWMALGVPAEMEGQGRSAAEAVVDRALERMGGEEALRSVERSSMRMMTQWQRPSFRDIPHLDRPSFESHRDNRDYTIPAWRNTREFGSRNIVNVIRDSIAVTTGVVPDGEGFGPLSVAYVDEREELFMYTPNRLVLHLADADDLRAQGDTLLGGEPHRVVSATLADRFPATVFFHAATGLPTLLRFHAAHFNDFGLVPWGEMEVRIWYSNWRTFDGISIPTQWDTERVGEPYKRMTVLSLAVNPEFAADSFAVSDEDRSEYLNSTAVLPMHEGASIRSTEMHPDGIAVNEAFGFPIAAVDVGDSWILIGAGQTSYSFEVGVDALAGVGVGSLGGVVAGVATTGDGGVVAAADRDLPIYVSVSSEPFVRTMLRNAGREARIVRVDRPRTVGSGSERLEMAPLALPDVPGSMMIFDPSSGWLYLTDATDPMHTRMGLEEAARLGWTVRSVGTRRAVREEIGGGV